MITQVITSEIKTAKYNPKARVEHLGTLMKSIKEFGIIMPLVIDADKNLIDGHRRLASAKLLKMAKVPVVQINGNLAKDKAYEIINTTSKRISNHDFIYIHINGGSIPKRALNKINLLEEVVGTDGLKKLGDKGVTYTVLDCALMVQKYCSERNNNTFLKRAIFWLSDNKMIYAVRRAMESKVKKETIQRAVAVGRPLKIKYA